MTPCWKCGAPGASEIDDMCDACYEQERWEQITAINCNPQVDEYIPDDADPDIEEI